MKTGTLVAALCRDFMRSGSVLLEVVLVSFSIAMLLNPRENPFEWYYLSMTLSWMAVALVALTTLLLLFRNAEQKLDILVLKAGRVSYYFSIALAALLITFLWLAVILLWVFQVLTIAGPSFPPEPGKLALGILLNLLVVTAVFLLFSSLTGRPLEVLYAVLLTSTSFGTGYFAGMSQPWHLVEFLLPPIIENVQASVHMADVQLIRSLVYFAAIFGMGLWRFTRREFIWS